MKKYLIILVFLFCLTASAQTPAENARNIADEALSDQLNENNAKANAKKIEAISNPVQTTQPAQEKAPAESLNKYLIILLVVLGLGVIGFLIKKNRNKIK